jgi:hypothetical protein
VRTCAAKCFALGIGDQWQPHREGHHEPIQYLLVQRGAHLFNNMIWIRPRLQLLSLNAPLRNEPENLDIDTIRGEMDGSIQIHPNAASTRLKKLAVFQSALNGHRHRKAQCNRSITARHAPVDEDSAIRSAEVSSI